MTIQGSLLDHVVHGVELSYLLLHCVLAHGALVARYALTAHEVLASRPELDNDLKTLEFSLVLYLVWVNQVLVKDCTEAASLLVKGHKSCVNSESADYAVGALLLFVYYLDEDVVWDSDWKHVYSHILPHLPLLDRIHPIFENLSIVLGVLDLDLKSEIGLN